MAPLVTETVIPVPGVCDIPSLKVGVLLVLRIGRRAGQKRLFLDHGIIQGPQLIGQADGAFGAQQREQDHVAN